LTDILKAEGYEVRSAINGELALLAAASSPPELVLLDIRMPGMDGYEVCRRLKAQSATRDVPVIFVSAASETADKVQGFEIGAVDYVTKPYQRNELLARVRTHVELNRLRHGLEGVVSERTAELKESEERWKFALEGAGDGVWDWNPKTDAALFTRRWKEMLGYAEHEFPDTGTAWVEHLHPEDKDRVLSAVHDYFAGKQPSYVVEFRMRCKDGSWKWIMARGKLVGRDAGGAPVRVIGTHTDISLRKAAEEEISNLAFFDPLTHLPNRRLLTDRLTQALVSSARSAGVGALLFIDLDDFKTLNDTLGHDIGDLLLQQVALRLTSCVREGDTVARFGGDEFVVMLEDLSHDLPDAAAQAKMVGEKILTSLDQSYRLGRYEHHSTPSIGVTLFNGNQPGIDELMKQADIAMYQAKKQGRNTLRFFDPHMQDVINARADIEADLRHALESRQFHLYYQIQVDNFHHAVGAEALIRWIHPERGMVSPAQFIPLAEETGLILPIGLWVLETACAQLDAWGRDALTRDLILAVNVSARQFRQPDFASQVLSVVQRHAINATRLKLELTESLLLDDVEDIIVKMSALKEIGIQFSLDDFGTGYSSLQYLKRLPLDQLKIDQSFVRDIACDASDKAIVRTIIAMAHSLSLEVIAEGVETEEQRQFILDNGCEQFQGYLFGRPVPLAEFEALLRNADASAELRKA
jgi:diguanylate cyclase (GGDEF)-like protein/PAS domain S-box-containing protein